MGGGLNCKLEEKKIIVNQTTSFVFHTEVQFGDSGLTTVSLCDRWKPERAGERANHGMAGVFMGGVKVSAPGRAVIVGDTLIKMF